MKIIVEKIEANNIVYFTSEFGKAKAKWNDGKPKCKTYDVEIDIENCLKWDIDIKKTLKPVDLIFIDKKGKIIITGIFESIDEDGYTILRIGNSIITFLTEGSIPEIGSPIELNVDLIYIASYE